MTALYIVGGLLLLVVLLLSSPVSLHFHYSEQPLCTLRVWGAPIRLLPHTEKQTPSKKEGAKPQEKKPSALLTELTASFKQDGVAATLHWLGELARLLTDTVGRVLQSVTVTRFQLEMRISGEDASAAAIRFGEVCAVLYPLLSVISCHLRIKKRQVELRPDFEGLGTAVLLDIRCKISLWRVCGALLAALFRFVKIQVSDR